MSAVVTARLQFSDIADLLLIHVWAFLGVRPPFDYGSHQDPWNPWPNNDDYDDAIDRDDFVSATDW